jgi:hypothetical protein
LQSVNNEKTAIILSNNDKHVYMEPLNYYLVLTTVN